MTQAKDVDMAVEKPEPLVASVRLMNQNERALPGEKRDGTSPVPVARRSALKKLASTMTAIIGLGSAAASRASAQATGGSTLVSANWTHGLSVQVEDPSRIASLVRLGYQAEVRTYGQTWVHFAIPTPVIQSGSRLRLARVRLLWGTDNVYYTLPPMPIGAAIYAVHVWDGNKKLAEFGEVPTIGVSNLYGYDPTNPFDIPGSPYVYYGVGISLLIDAPVGINLRSAGGEFYIYSSGCLSC
jgi:hypothetical protein